MMSDAGDETAALREMAANRGCRLVKSRRRKPGGDFGRYGLTDAKSGKEIFGFGKSGLEASAEEIAEFLRKRTLSTWESSLGAVGRKAANPRGKAERPAARPQRERPKTSKPARWTAKPTSPPPSPRDVEALAPAATPPLRIRVADAVDGEAIAALLGEVGIEASPDELADRIGRLSRLGEPVLVAKLGDELVGCAVWHVLMVLHRPQPVGRITILVVASTRRRNGIGRALAEAAEARLVQRGCGLLEATGDPKARAAQAFYDRLGYEPTGRLFTKQLAVKSA